MLQRREIEAANDFFIVVMLSLTKYNLCKSYHEAGKEPLAGCKFLDHISHRCYFVGTLGWLYIGKTRNRSALVHIFITKI